MIDTLPPLPRFAQIEPVGRCNLACRMCTVHERGDAVAELSLERYVALLDQMPGLARLHLQGLGEPMLHPRFFEMVELAVARGIRVSANSNLTLLTERRAARCVASGLATLSVSLDGASAAVYEAIRRRASFAKVLRNLDRLVAARDASARTPALGIRLVMVLMRANLHELPARYIPIRDYVHAAELVDDAAIRPVFEAARARALELGVALHLPRLGAGLSPEPPARRAGAGCGWPWEQLYVTAAGELLPCCMVASADRASFGNVFEGGLAARWHGAAARTFRAQLAGTAPPAPCRSCALYRGAF
ncbi:MAG TPA: radical SAM protein [Burkholderiaceae bacterium]